MPNTIMHNLLEKVTDLKAEVDALQSNESTSAGKLEDFNTQLEGYWLTYVSQYVSQNFPEQNSLLKKSSANTTHTTKQGILEALDSLITLIKSALASSNTEVQVEKQNVSQEANTTVSLAYPEKVDNQYEDTSTLFNNTSSEALATVSRAFMVSLHNSALTQYNFPALQSSRLNSENNGLLNRQIDYRNLFTVVIWQVLCQPKSLLAVNLENNGLEIRLDLDQLNPESNILSILNSESKDALSVPEEKVTGQIKIFAIHIPLAQPSAALQLVLNTLHSQMQKFHNQSETGRNIVLNIVQGVVNSGITLSQFLRNIVNNNKRYKTLMTDQYKLDSIFVDLLSSMTNTILEASTFIAPINLAAPVINNGNDYFSLTNNPSLPTKLEIEADILKNGITEHDLPAINLKPDKVLSKQANNTKTVAQETADDDDNPLEDIHRLFDSKIVEASAQTEPTTIAMVKAIQTKSLPMKDENVQEASEKKSTDKAVQTDLLGNSKNIPVDDSNSNCDYGDNAQTKTFKAEKGSYHHISQQSHNTSVFQEHNNQSLRDFNTSGDDSRKIERSASMPNLSAKVDQCAQIQPVLKNPLNEQNASSTNPPVQSKVNQEQHHPSEVAKFIDWTQIENLVTAISNHQGVIKTPLDEAKQNQSIEFTKGSNANNPETYRLSQDKNTGLIQLTAQNTSLVSFTATLTALIQEKMKVEPGKPVKLTFHQLAHADKAQYKKMFETLFAINSTINVKLEGEAGNNKELAEALTDAQPKVQAPLPFLKSQSEPTNQNCEHGFKRA